MFMIEQEESWSNAHLKLCHWYLEMPKDESPLHEELRIQHMSGQMLVAHLGHQLKMPRQAEGQVEPPR